MKITSKTRRSRQPAFVNYVPPPKPVAYQIRDAKVNSLMENRTPVLHYTLQSDQSSQISRSI